MNKQRGEHTIILNGQTYALRPTFAALAAIESRTGVGIIELVNRFISGQHKVGDTVAVIEEGIRAAGGDVPTNVGELIVGAGYIRCYGDCVHFLNKAVSDPDKKQDQAATA